MVDPDLLFIVSYACPRCHAMLEARTSGPPSWLRCPTCGKASLPPEDDRISPSPSPPALVVAGHLPVGSSATGKAFDPTHYPARSVTPLPASPRAVAPTARILLGSGLLLSMTLMIFSLLDGQGGRVGFFGLIAVSCMILLTRGRGRPANDGAVS